MIPYIKGKVSRQAHVDVPEGIFEEEFARSGFFGRYAHLYRSKPPVAWTKIEGPLKPRAYDFKKIPSTRSDYLKARVSALGNADVNIAFCQLEDAMPYYFRNADGDEVIFVHEGNGILETDFGPLTYNKGDYLVIPRGTVYRLSPKQSSSFLIVESFSEIQFPEKGMLGQHALFDPAVLGVPIPDPENRHAPLMKEFELKVKREGELTSIFYPFCPITTVGWKGTLTVWQLNVADIRPVISERYHLPPSAHTTFVAKGFVICSFLPRGLETGDPNAMKVPFYHSNIDYDEVLFYHDGDFFSRSGIKAGMMTFHPQGIHHGPQPNAIERSKNATRTNEIAVMIDTQRPLKIMDAIRNVELKNYWESWSQA